MCLENLIITTKYFPIRIPFLYKIGLKKLTLHEVAHIFGRRNSFFTKFSIMDNFFGLFISRFTKKQKRKIKRYLKKNPKIRDKLFSE
jgi:DNA-binding transcriptional regulator GbsR (MarR family)